MTLLPVKILVVDDEPDLHLLIRRTFKRQQHDWVFRLPGSSVRSGCNALRNS